MPTPAEAFPPGEYLQDELDARGWSIEDLAERIGWPTEGLRAVAEGRRRVSKLVAKALAEAFGTHAQTWLNLQASYDERLAAQELQRITPPNAELLKLADRNPPPQEWFDEDPE